ncbi:MAG TPA: tRNA pseudouridine(38-40) synthase TruA, partial [Aggregatilineales bacterium]|nr:tRNA pseudouridine(38-40) synthase TruA [Aggregatilineales bacterium]
ALETALRQLSGEPIPTIAAGRTDAGVHATGQVVAFDLSEKVWRETPEVLTNALNAHLPKDIRVKGCALAAPTFHPRYDALSRIYEYRVYVDKTPLPLLDQLAWWVRHDPDLAAMNLAAADLVGRHDFLTFGTPPLGKRGTTTRTVFRAEWAEEQPLFGARRIVFTIEADAFLYHMVRSVTAALVKVGDGRLGVGDIAHLLNAKQRGAIKALAPAQGLTLVGVTYPPGDDTIQGTDAREDARSE